MRAARILAFFLLVILSVPLVIFAAEETNGSLLQPIEPLVGSWSFSGMVTDESGNRYGYFFQMHRQEEHFQVKTALIDDQNQLKLFYEDSEDLISAAPLNWHIGHSFIRYNPINDSWIFGVKLGNGQGYNFKVDMLKEEDNDSKPLTLRPGVELQALQTSRLNGHIKIEKDVKEQFVTGNNAWFGKVWFSRKQNTPHEISTTFCRLSNDNGFYSANLKEEDATGAAVAGWRDPLGNKVKMSQFVSIKNQADNQCLLHVGLPKLDLNVINTLKQEDQNSLSVAGFSKDNKGFCFVIEQSFSEIKTPGQDNLIA